MWQDFRYGVRMLARKPGFTLAAVLTLAIGVGANTAIFSVVNAVLLRGLPFPQSSLLVQVFQTLPREGINNAGVSYPNFRDWQQQNSAFEQIAAEHSGAMTLIGRGEPRNVFMSAVTAGVFPMLRAQAQLGRVFVPDDDRPGAERLAIISEALWRREFNASPAIIGQTLSLDGQPFASRRHARCLPLPHRVSRGGTLGAFGAIPHDA
jgi:hypothetical protein